MGKLGSFLRTTHFFAPGLRGCNNHGLEQFQGIPIFSAHIWAWRHTGAWGSGTLKTPRKVDPPGGPDYSTANSKSKHDTKIFSKNQEKNRTIIFDSELSEAKNEPTFRIHQKN